MELGFVNGYRNARYQTYLRWQRWVEANPNVVMAMSAIAMALVTGALAQVKLYTPLTPVPYTLQVLGISLTGGLLGRKWGTVSASLYVLLGLAGLPIYANGASGPVVFETGLSAGYILGFVPQAFLVGWIADRRSQGSDLPLVATSAVAGTGLLAIALLDVYLLADYGKLFTKAPTAFPNVWFLLLSATLILLVVAAAWLAFTSRARRERIELFMGNVVGLVALYAAGAVWFYLMWQNLGFGPLDFQTWMRYTVLPFIPADLTKILCAILFVTLLRPTQREIEAGTSGGPRADV